MDFLGARLANKIDAIVGTLAHSRISLTWKNINRITRQLRLMVRRSSFAGLTRS